MNWLGRLLGRADERGTAADTFAAGEVSTVGWDAIDDVLKTRYGDQEPAHFGTLIRFRLGGPDPLDGISAYRNEGPPPHWHFVTYGLSELYEKESENTAESGWGIELTFRLTRKPDDDQPPNWALSFLQNLARYVFESGNALLPGHHIDGRGPIALDEPTELVGGLFAMDPELGEIDTPHGHLRFVQVIGLTRDEYDAVKAWNSGAFVSMIARTNPLLVTDLTRQSMLADAAVAREVQIRTEAEGSSTGGIYIDHLTWEIGDQVAVEIGASAVSDLVRLLRDRVGVGQDAFVEGRYSAIRLRSGEAWAHATDDAVLSVTLPPSEASALASLLQPRAAEYILPSLPGLLIRIVPSVITDAAGREVQRIG